MVYNQNSGDLTVDTPKKTIINQQNNDFSNIIIDLSCKSSDLLREIINDVKRNNKIDQKFLYVDPVSVLKWNKLISSDDYVTYKDCNSALDNLLKSKSWEACVKNNNIQTVVDLGVGAGEKDNKILKNLVKLSSAPTVHFVLVDTSFPMLESTLYSLSEYLEEVGGKVSVKAIKTDFMCLSPSIDHLHNSQAGTAFFMLGCTLCNLRERDILNSISNVSTKGDIFVIGVETFNPDDIEASMERIKYAYDHNSLRELAVIPLKMVYGDIDDKKLIKNIDIQITNHHSYSSVKGASSIAILAKAKDKTITLASSSRYDEDNLVKFIEGFDFNKIATINSSTNQYYKHIIFERKI